MNEAEQIWNKRLSEIYPTYRVFNEAQGNYDTPTEKQIKDFLRFLQAWDGQVLTGTNEKMKPQPIVAPEPPAGADE